MPGARILIVEDEEYLAENLYDFLKLEGFTPVIRNSVETALILVDTDPPDLVILDIQLPGMNGMEVLRQLKEINPALPVVIVSASSQKGTLEKIQEYHGDAMVMKPYDQDHLLQVIHDLLCRGLNHAQT
ncbi:MAG: response regulator [bacterium]